MTVIRNVNTGTYHTSIGESLAISCCSAHGGTRSLPRTRKANPNEIIMASDTMFCKKCFDHNGIAFAKGYDKEQKI